MALALDGLLVDMYGTLTTGDRAAVEAACARIVADTGVGLSPRALSVTWGERFFHAMDFCNNGCFRTLFEIEAQTLAETMAALGVTIEPGPYVQVLADYWRDPPLQPEARAFLATCPVPVCIVSNADREDLAAALARHGLRVAGVVTSEELRCYKPDPRIFAHAVRAMGWRREHVLHVGDSLHSDVGGALLAGIRSVWINRAHRIHDIGTHTPDYEFPDLLALGAVLGGPGAAG